MGEHTIKITMAFDVGEAVTHDKHGAGIIVGYAAAESARGSQSVVRRKQATYYVVAFGADYLTQENCETWELSSVPPPAAEQRPEDQPQIAVSE